jgi:hypothetical protein
MNFSLFAGLLAVSLVAPHISHSQTGLIHPKGSTLAIVDSKRPWYGFRSLLIKKFKEVLPDYQAAPGLLLKSFDITEDKKHFGGIYLWQNDEAARAWYSPAWYAKATKRTGVAPVVTYYSVKESVIVVQNLPRQGQYWAVLCLKPGVVYVSAIGLLQLISLNPSEQAPQGGSVSLWKTKKEAEQVFGKDRVQVRFFDAPVVLSNL